MVVRVYTFAYAMRLRQYAGAERMYISVQLRAAGQYEQVGYAVELRWIAGHMERMLAVELLKFGSGFVDRTLTLS